jgi:hypothetical protein
MRNAKCESPSACRAVALAKAGVRQANCSIGPEINLKFEIRKLIGTLDAF